MPFLMLAFRLAHPPTAPHVTTESLLHVIPQMDLLFTRTAPMNAILTTFLVSRTL